jgi:hypothetical protein
MWYERLPTFLALVQNHQDAEIHALIESDLGTWAQRRQLCTTRKERLASVPRTAKEGDLICILYGGEVPYILRPRIDGEYEYDHDHPPCKRLESAIPYFVEMVINPLHGRRVLCDGCRREFWGKTVQTCMTSRALRATRLLLFN